MNIKHPALFVFFISLIFAGGCSFPTIEDTAARHKIDHPFFPLREYVTSEALRLGVLQPEVIKTVTINGDTETRQFPVNELMDAMQAFIDADINRPAYYDQYTTLEDTLANGNIRLFHRAINEKLWVRQIKVLYQNGRVTELEIKIENRNFIFHSSRLLTYHSGQSFTIHSTQKVLFAPERYFSVNGDFIFQ